MSNKSAQNILPLAVCSDLRRNILISLIDGKKPLGDLRIGLKILATTAIHALRELEKNNLVHQEKDKNYALTNIGRIVALKLLDFSNTSEALKKHERFWLEHDLSGIPDHMLKKIGWLKNSDMIQINPLDIIKTHNSFINFVKNAKWIRGVSPLFSTDYPIIFKDVVEMGINTQLILTDSVLGKLIDTIGLENLKKLIHNHSLELLVTEENLKVAFMVTDAFLSLGLFANNGVYDITHDLIGTDDRTVYWGHELFEYYRGKAKKYEI